MVNRVRTINEFHEMVGLVTPNHPLICVVDTPGYDGKWGIGCYAILLRGGVISFMAPNQVFDISAGWLLLMHPDFIYNTPLAQKIKQYEFFDYAVEEALFMCPEAVRIITDIIQMIQRESHKNIDRYSQPIIVSHIESLLNYAERFYHQQFITRIKTHHQIIDDMNRLLNSYFHDGHMGLPTVKYLSDRLGISQGYLRDLLKSLTGKNTQQHIHEHLIGIAKEKLSTTNLSVSEIAYELGFEHAQSFSKLFKLKTKQSPMAYQKMYITKI